MLLNADRSRHLNLLLKGDALRRQQTKVSMNGVGISQARSLKYLGTVFTTYASWTVQVNKVFTSYAQQNGMLRLLRSKLCQEVHVILRNYVRLVRPGLEYACAAWSVDPTAELIEVAPLYCATHLFMIS